MSYNASVFITEEEHLAYRLEEGVHLFVYSALRYVAVTAKKAKLVRSFNCFIARVVERLHPYRKGHVFQSL